MATDDRPTGPQGPVVVTPYVLGRDGKLRGPQPHGPIYYNVPGSHVDVGTFGTGNPSAHSAYSAAMQSTGDNGATTIRSGTPLPLQGVDPAIFSNWDQPQQQPPQRSVPFVLGGPTEPPFPPPTNNDQAAGIGVAGEVDTVVLNDEQRFETLEARVAVLEAALASRPAGVTLAPRPPGIGHNSGTYIDENLNVDETSIQNLIALLIVPRATAPFDLAKLAEAAQVADPGVNKWQERVDAFVKGVLFGGGKMAGEEIAKQLEHASWVRSVFSALEAVFEAIKAFF
jgi:hypothetical protein